MNICPFIFVIASLLFIHLQYKSNPILEPDSNTFTLDSCMIDLLPGVTFNVSTKSLRYINIDEHNLLSFERLAKHIKININQSQVLQSSKSDCCTYHASFENGFVGTIFESYNGHHNLIIRPDDVWIAILIQFNRYVNANYEQLRKHFVNFDGQKELIVEQHATLHTNRFDSFAKMMVDKLSENIVDPNMTAWIIPNFTTTTETDRVAASIIMMSTLQSFFKYQSCLACGIPQVTLLGTVDDWIDIRNRAKKLIDYDITIDKTNEHDEEFEVD